MGAKKRKAEHDDSGEDDGLHASEDSPVAKKARKFSMNSFQERLKENTVPVLMEFALACDASEDGSLAVVSEFLANGGEPLQIVKLLHSASDDDKKTLILPVFTVLKHLLTCYMKVEPQHQQVLEAASWQLLQVQPKIIHQALTTTKGTGTCKAILTTLAAIVTINPKLAKEVLTNINLTSKLAGALAKQTSAVRTCFIHFLMAFLITGNISVIELLCSKKGILTSVVPDLISDPLDTVVLFLTTLRYRLVEHRVAKRSKMAMFTTAVLRNLLQLYHWVGPRGLQGKGHASKLVNVEVDEESRELVAQAVHGLLLVLCTSHKHNIIFHGQGAISSNRKHNMLVKTMLEELKEPWENELQWELVLKTLVNCPDMVKVFVSRIDAFLEPRNSLKWFRIVNFYKQLVESLNPKVCLHSGDEVFDLLVMLVAPPSVLKVAGRESLLHSRLSVRHHLTSLLCTMLRATERFLASVETRKLCDASELRAEMTAHLLKHLPSGSVLIRAWRKAFDEAGKEDNDDEVDVVNPPSLQDHVSLLIDLLDIYGRCCPRMLPDSVLEPHRLLTDVLALSVDSSEVVKTLSALFSLDPSGFSPEKELFKTAVTLLLGLMDSPHSNVVQQLLQAILHRIGMFKGDGSELLVWLHCYLGAHLDGRPAVQHLLTDALVGVAVNPRPFADTLSTAVQSAKQHCYSPCDKDVNEILQEILDNGGVSGELNVAHSSTSLSLLLPAVLQLAADRGEPVPEVVEFISFIVVHLLHDCVSASIMWHLLERRQNLVLQTVWKYVRGWLLEYSPTPLSKPFRISSVERKLSQCFLQSHEMSITEIFGDLSFYAQDNHKTEITDDILNSLPVKNSFQTLLLMKLSFFHVTQLIATNNFTKQLCENYQQSLMCLLSIFRTLSATQTEEVGIRCEEKLFENFFKCLFTHPALLSAFTLSNKHVVSELMADFVTGVIRTAGRMVSQDVLTPLRQKLVKCTSLWVRKYCKNNLVECDEEKLLPLLELFEFDLKELMELLEEAAVVPTELLCQDDGSQLSLLGSMLSFLLLKISLLHVSGTHQRSVMLQNTVENVASHLESLQDRNVMDVCKLEEGFLQFIQKYPHHLAYVKEGFFKCLLKNRNHSTSAVKICVFLLERNKEFVGVFSKLALKHKRILKSAICIFSVLSAALSHGRDAVDRSLLQRVYEHYRHDIYQAVLLYSKSPAWVKANIGAIVLLVDTCMGAETCKELYLQVKDKCVAHRNGHRQLLHSVFVRAGCEEEEGVLAVWCGMLFSATVAACRKQSGTRKLIQLCQFLHRCVVLAGTNGLEDVQGGEHWWEFAQLALAVGLKHTPQLLATLRELCDVLYQDSGNHPQVMELFNMLVSHSRFMPVIISDDSAKRSVIELLLVVTKKAPSVMNSSHVATLLGSYGASLSSTDQLILRLLRQYESSGVSLQKCRPYLWGEAAVIHYSVRSQLAASLWQQPSVSQVLQLFTPDMVANTINYFPVTRQLDVKCQLHTNQPHMYDPAFFLPLLSHLLSPENLLPFSQVHQSGALALCIAALSSDHHPVRQAACHAIALFYFNVESSRQKNEKQVWLQLVDALRDGMPEGPEVPQLPSITTVYLAQATRHISNPLSNLCLPLHNYVCLRPALNLHTVPDFLRLFHSDDVYFKDHRQFILEVLHSGIRREVDFNLVHKAVIYKMIMTFYSSVLADEHCKVLILQAMQSSVKIPKAASVLVSSYGLLSWLDSVVTGLERDQPRRTNAALRVLSCLWTSLKEHPGAVAGLILKLLLALLPKLHLKLNAKILRVYLDALSGSAAAATIQLPWLLTLSDVNAVLRYCQGILGPVQDLEDLLLFGPEFAHQRIQKDATKELASVRYHLRCFILTRLKQASQSK